MKEINQIDYINFGYPVYISYARENNDYPYIEIPVRQFIDKLNAERIYCKMDRNSNVERITAFEREIGKGEIVVIFLSRKYLESRHCMFEWAEIHKNVANKLIIYVKFDGLVECRKKKWDYTNWLADLIKYWEDKFNDYWKYHVKTCVEPTPVDKESYKYNFFRQHIMQIECGEKRDYTNWYYTSDRTALDSIVAKLNKHINDTIGKLYKERVYQTLAGNQSILFVGDSILTYRDENVDNGKVMLLGEYIEKRLLHSINHHESTLYESIDECPQECYQEYINNEYVEIIKQLDKDRLSNNYLVKLLDNPLFDTFVIAGYSSLIWDTINDSIRKDTAKIVYDLRDGYFVENRDDSNLNPKNKIEEKSIIKVYRAYQTNSEQLTEKDIIFTEFDAIRFTNNFIQGIAKDNNRLRNKSLLMLGTNLPGWSVKLIWASLSQSGKNRSLICNKNTDTLTKSFIQKNDGFMIDNEQLIPFIDKFGDMIKENSNVIKNGTNVYVFYFEDTEQDKSCFDKFRSETLEKIEEHFNVHFIWRNGFVNKKFTFKCINNCDYFILYGAKNTFDPKLYNYELNLIKEVTNSCRGNVFTICKDNPVTNPAYPGLLSYDERYCCKESDDLGSKIKQFIEIESKERIKEFTKTYNEKSNNVYILYMKRQFEKFISFYLYRLKEIEKEEGINFVWKDFDNIEKCTHFVLFVSDPPSEKDYNDREYGREYKKIIEESKKYKDKDSVFYIYDFDDNKNDIPTPHRFRYDDRLKFKLKDFINDKIGTNNGTN